MKLQKAQETRDVTSLSRAPQFPARRHADMYVSKTPCRHVRKQDDTYVPGTKLVITLRYFAYRGFLVDSNLCQTNTELSTSWSKQTL